MESELPLWQCHKQVRAARIVHIDTNITTNLTTLTMSSGAERVVPNDWAFKHEPKTGGYFVEYADGYVSYSPPQAFEKGYSRVPEEAKR